MKPNRNKNRTNGRAVAPIAATAEEEQLTYLPPDSTAPSNDHDDDDVSQNIDNKSSVSTINASSCWAGIGPDKDNACTPTLPWSHHFALAIRDGWCQHDTTSNANATTLPTTLPRIADSISSQGSISSTARVSYHNEENDESEEIQMNASKDTAMQQQHVQWEQQLLADAHAGFCQRMQTPLVRLDLEQVEQSLYYHEPTPSLLQQGLSNLIHIRSIRRGGRGTNENDTVVGTLRLSILPLVSSSSSSSSPNKKQKLIQTTVAGGMLTPRSFRPGDLIDIEEGQAVVLLQHDNTNNNNKSTSSSMSSSPQKRHQDVSVVTAAIPNASIVPSLIEAAQRDQEKSTTKPKHSMLPIHPDRVGLQHLEVGFLGRVWRSALKAVLRWTMDEINALRLSRLMQNNLPFLTGYESYIVSQLIQALDEGSQKEIELALTVAFQNRNVSRIVVQTVRARHDFFFHWGTAISWNRWFVAFGQLPVIGITRFPATENFPSTRDHALASIFRVVLGQGNWITRVVTRGREGLITDNPKALAQNLTAESNGFELANRNQYGTHFGRIKTNQFRLAHRLPTDESLVRTFIAQPLSTAVNNGVVHLLRQLSRHWHNMLRQEYGNFAHQRMEQLAPFETLRFHVPEVLQVLASLRGRNRWDSQVLGPTIQHLQKLGSHNNLQAASQLNQYLIKRIAGPVSGGVLSVYEPLKSWLNAIGEALTRIREEAHQVFQLVSSVELGIRLGYDVMSQVNWKVPKDSQLMESIIAVILGHGNDISYKKQVLSALQLTTPRDKRTLIELVKNDLAHTKPARLLLARTKTLLQRELRREYMNLALQSLSKGDFVRTEDLIVNDWYWLEGKGVVAGAYTYMGCTTELLFQHVDSGTQTSVSFHGSVDIRKYVPVSEAITRAQKVFMTIELIHGRTFTYNAFMEFPWLRPALRKLVVVSQMACEMLDKGRLNVLSELMKSKRTDVTVDDLVPGRKYYLYDKNTMTFKPFVFHQRTDELVAATRIVTMLPQSVIVIGGGPTGLMSAIHCAENCIASGGTMKLFEARDSFDKGGSTYERAQIVRLDARWIATLRYHLGTGFEDVYIPASGETDSQLGNTLPSQGFVEITIKDLENMLHVEVARLWSRGIIQLFTDSKAQYDPETNALTKLGRNLKVGDSILRRVDEEGRQRREHYTWHVVELSYKESLSINELKVGREYGIFVRATQTVGAFKLESVNLETKTYLFRSQNPDVNDIRANVKSLPSVYPAGTGVGAHGAIDEVVLESVNKDENGLYLRQRLSMKDICDEKFSLDTGHTHVFEAIGKPPNSSVHFTVVTPEPHAVCCVEGLKVSMGMHNFGEKRFGTGILDDIRSINDQNTRIIGDFTKMVRVAPIVKGMEASITTDDNWKAHFSKIISDSPLSGNVEPETVVRVIVSACKWLAGRAEEFQRQTVQTRFFETGDNFYLGMEMLREFDRWKNHLAKQLVAPLSGQSREIDILKRKLTDSIDRLWYENCLETIRKGDVYNPGARRRVPKLYLINAVLQTKLKSLPLGESFRLADDMKEKYEILDKGISDILVRNVQGYVQWLPKATMVYRESNLTRCPDGNQESKVALSTFPVAHVVNYRTMRLSNREEGFIFAFAGDSQATPHFMRYSGLTGACINVASFNTFLRGAIDGIPFVDRFREYSKETNWSNGEVVQRGTTSNYGEDGFLRPGFSYQSLVDYLHSKIIEYQESGQTVDDILSHDWNVKIAASLVPRGLEMNDDFISRLRWNFHHAVFQKVASEAKTDERLKHLQIEKLMNRRMKQLLPLYNEAGYHAPDLFWNQFCSEINVSQFETDVLEQEYCRTGKLLDRICAQVIEFAKKAYIYDKRISSELRNQPKSVDSIVDDFAVEAQNFANALALSAAFAAGALAFRLIGDSVADLSSAILGGLNIAIAFGTMTNAARYKIRNEEMRVVIMDEKYQDVKKAAFALLDEETRNSFDLEMNPFFISLDKKVDNFLLKAKYYNYREPIEFNAAYERLKGRINDIAEIQRFQALLLCKFIAGTYHVNSYVQEALVEVFRAVSDMLSLLVKPIDVDMDLSTQTDTAKDLFLRLDTLEDKFQDSLQRGPVKWGFVKQRRLGHWDFVVILRYFYSILWMPCCKGLLPAPVQWEIRNVLQKAKEVSRIHHNTVLRREVRNLATLFWATRESDVASMIFVTASLTFVASIIFTLARLFRIDILNDFSFFAFALSALGAILAAFHFVRKSKLLMGLLFELQRKKKLVPNSQKGNVRQLVAVTAIQLFLTMGRLLASGLAAVALPFAVAENGFSESIQTNKNIAFWIALGAVVSAIAATLVFLLVEYVVRYNLTPYLGPFVCELFRPEIEAAYEQVKIPRNQIDTMQLQERETWEYAAREFLHRYRFDTVFAADRFGQLLQYIQAGKLFQAGSLS